MRVRYVIIPVLLVLAAFATNLTASAKAPEESFSFVVLGHIRGHQDGTTHPLLDELVAEVRELAPDMIFLTGDMIWGFVTEPLADAEVVTQDWDQLDAKLGSLGVPIYRVPGNHDINDPVTRDIYFARYGELPEAVTYRGSRFILLNSTYVPEGDDPSRKYILTERLDAGQVAFVQEELSRGEPYDHVFLFVHHVLWWEDDAPWWSDVHPLLVGQNVDAVFSGDFGPAKFSYLRRDEIDYIRSVTIGDVYGVETGDLSEELGASVEDRVLAQQFDNFLYVTVDGQRVNIEVKTVGALSTGKFTPQRFREMNGPQPVQEEWVYDPKEPTLVERMWNMIGTPRRLVALAGVMGICLLGGMATGMIWQRRRIR